MGSITFQVTGATGVSHSKTFTVTNPNINRMIAQIKDGEPGLTTVQAIERWAELMMNITKDRVVGHERAAAAVPPFDAT